MPFRNLTRDRTGTPVDTSSEEGFGEEGLRFADEPNNLDSDNFNANVIDYDVTPDDLIDTETDLRPRDNAGDLLPFSLTAQFKEVAQYKARNVIMHHGYDFNDSATNPFRDDVVTPEVQFRGPGNSNIFKLQASVNDNRKFLYRACSYIKNGESIIKSVYVYTDNIVISGNGTFRLIQSLSDEPIVARVNTILPSLFAYLNDGRLQIDIVNVPQNSGQLIVYYQEILGRNVGTETELHRFDFDIGETIEPIFYDNPPPNIPVQYGMYMLSSRGNRIDFENNSVYTYVQSENTSLLNVTNVNYGSDFVQIDIALPDNDLDIKNLEKLTAYKIERYDLDSGNEYDLGTFTGPTFYDTPKLSKDKGAPPPDTDKSFYNVIEVKKKTLKTSKTKKELETALYDTIAKDNNVSVDKLKDEYEAQKVAKDKGYIPPDKKTVNERIRDGFVKNKVDKTNQHVDPKEYVKTGNESSIKKGK